MRPLSGSSSPARSRQRVVLPAPFGPTRPMRSPSAIRHDSAPKSCCPAYAFWMSSTWIMREGRGVPSSQRLNLLGEDLHGHADLVGAAVRVLVLPEILLGERIDVRVGPLLRHLGDAPTDLDVPVGVVRVLDREGDPRVLPEVPVLHPPARGVDPHVGTIPVAPDRRDLRRVVGADGRQVGKRLLREEVAVVLRNRRHAQSPLAALSCSSTENAWRTDLAASVPPISSPMSSVSAISASVAPWSRTSSTRWSIQSKQFCETATASTVSSLCFLDSARSAKTSLPISPKAR